MITELKNDLVLPFGAGGEPLVWGLIWEFTSDPNGSIRLQAQCNAVADLRSSGHSRPMLPSDTQRAYVEFYVQKCLPILGLTDWQVDTDFKDTDEWLAEVRALEGTRTGDISFSKKFWEADDKLKVWTICHELIHLHTSEMCQSVEGAFKTFVGESAWEGVHYGFSRCEELCVDNLARVFSRLLPQWKEPVAEQATVESGPSKPKKKSKNNTTKRSVNSGKKDRR